MTGEAQVIEQQRMEALRRYHLLDIAPNERFDRITLLVAQIFQVPTAVITLVDEHRQWFASRVGLMVRETAREIAFCNRTIEGSEVLVVSDAGRDASFRDNPLVTGELGLRFYAGAPLRTPEGHNIGTVAVIDYQPREFAAWEQRVLTELARFVMSEFELWRQLHEAGAQHRSELAALTRQHRQESALQERRFRALIEHAPDLVLLLDRELRVRFASPASSALLGYAPAELFGVDALQVLLADEQREQAQVWLRALVESRGTLHTHSWTLRTKRGEPVHVVTTVQNLFDEPGVAALVLNVRDVSQERRAQRELEQAREQLRQAERMEAVGRLAGGIAHDFNNLLTVVLNSAAFALRKLPEQAPARTDMEQIVEAAERGATLTRQILTFTENRLASVETMIDPNLFVRGLLELLRRVVGERIELSFRAGAELPSLRVDPAQLEQVLINLCVNARDAIAGSGCITLTTALVEVGKEQAARHPWAQPGPYVLFTVRDTGAGMSERVIEHAFEPFYTTKPVGKGTGLGLATAYGTVRQHGGLIEIDSALGQGTEVRMYVPVPPPDQQVDPPPAEPLRAGVARGHGAVLVADEDDLVRLVAQTALEDAGYRVYTAQDGPAALALFEQHAAELRLAIIDAELPRLRGQEVLERMRAVLPDFEYLLVSSQRAGQEGVPEGRCLSKPYRVEFLVARVHALLGD